MKARIIALSAAALILLFGARARADALKADALKIETVEERSWSAAVAALQNDRASEGHVIHVIVREADGTRVHCGTYALGLDQAASDAFSSDGCDHATDSTALRLVHRSALFEHGDVVPRPRAPRIVASRTQTGEAAGGAKSGAESAVDCAVTVRPFIRDLENGGRIELVPGRYALRAKTDDVKVKATEDGWTFIAPRGSHATVEYFVTDLKKEEVVLNDRVTMNCSVQTSAGTPIPSEVVSYEPLTTKPYVPAPLTDRDRERDHEAESGENRGGLPWRGYSTTANIGVGTAFMRTDGVRFANSAGSTDAAGLGLHDSGGPVVLGAVAYERPGMYGSFGGSVAATAMNHRTLWNFGVSSVVAAALHLGDTALYLGPDVQIGTYQVGSDTSEALAYTSKVALTLGGAMGVRFHMRDAKTGKLDYVIGAELVAPVAGPSPWFLTAQIAFGSGS